MKHDPEKEALWRERMKDYQSKDIPIRQFCEMHNVKAHQFHYWRRKFKVQNEKSKYPSPSFIEVKREADSVSSTGITLKVQGITITIPGDFNPVHLRKILKVVKSLD